MQPIVTAFINTFHRTKSISRILAILSEHPKLVQSLAQWNAIYIVNNKPVNKINGLQSPCNRDELVTNTIANITSLANSLSYGDEKDPMSPAYHKPIKVEVTPYAKRICKHLKDTLSPKYYAGLSYTPKHTTQHSFVATTSPYLASIDNKQTSMSNSSSSIDIKKIFGSSSAPQIISNKAKYQVKSKSPFLAKLLGEYKPSPMNDSTAVQTEHLVTTALQKSSKATSHKRAHAKHVKSAKSDSDIDAGFKAMLSGNSSTSSNTKSSSSATTNSKNKVTNNNSVASSSTNSKHSTSSSNTSIKHSSNLSSSATNEHKDAINGKNPF